MTKVEALVTDITKFTKMLMDNANKNSFYSYFPRDFQPYLNNINELSFEVRSYNFALYEDLQSIKQNMFYGRNHVNLFSLGRLQQILQMNVFNIKKNSIWAYTHSLITEKCQKKFMDGHYADSVETAMKEIISRVRKFRADNGHDEMPSESAMMENTFRRDNPLLHFTACSTTSENSIHNGYAKMLIGAVQAIRNPIAHDSVDMTEGDAARKLMLASDLMYRLDEAFEQLGG